MTIEREYYDGPIVVRCDGERCHEFDETHCTHFPSALAKIRSHGWTISKDRRGEWQHLCRDCSDEALPSSG